MMHEGWGSMGWEAMGFGMLFWIVLLVLVVVAIAWLFGEWQRGGDYSRHLERRSSALDILEERYARGEMDREEYLEKKRDLSDRASNG